MLPRKLGEVSSMHCTKKQGPERSSCEACGRLRNQGPTTTTAVWYSYTQCSTHRYTPCQSSWSLFCVWGRKNNSSSALNFCQPIPASPFWVEFSHLLVSMKVTQQRSCIVSEPTTIRNSQIATQIPEIWLFKCFCYSLLNLTLSVFSAPV